MSFNQITQSPSNNNADSKNYLDKKSSAQVSPKSAKGLSGWEFDIPDTEQIRLQADITDHYVENGSFINDHRVIKPIEVSLTGFIGELVYRPPEGVQGNIQELSNRLETVEAFLGNYTPGAVQSFQQALIDTNFAISTVNNTINQVKNIASFFDGEGSEETKQEKAFNELEAFFFQNELMTVQTPWRYFENMSIVDLAFNQSGESKGISDITISLKEWRFSDTQTVDYNENLFPVRQEIQATDTEDSGTVKGEEDDGTLLLNLVEGLT
jgi:hypothetical protein